METPGRTSTRRTSNILNYSSDFEGNSKRDSKWWGNLSDNTPPSSVSRRIRKRKSSNVLSPGSSIQSKELDSQWWSELPQSESFVATHDANSNKNKSGSPLAERERSPSESYSLIEENVVKTTLFKTRPGQSGKARFSKAFHLEKEHQSASQDAEEEARVSSDLNLESKSPKNVIQSSTIVSGKRKPVKIKKLFPRVTEGRRFSAAFDKSADLINPEQEHIQDQQDMAINSEDIIKNKSLGRKSEVLKIDSIVSTSGQIVVPEATKIDPIDITTNPKSKIRLFPKTAEKKRKFSDAFRKSTPTEEEANKIDSDNNSNPQTDKNISLRTETAKRRSLRRSVSLIPKLDNIDEHEPTTITQDSDLAEKNEPIKLFSNVVNKKRNFSAAFAKSRIMETTGQNWIVEDLNDIPDSSNKARYIPDKTTENPKSIDKATNIEFSDTIEHVDQSYKSSVLSTLPSITDASAGDHKNKLIFRPKARKSSFSLKSATKTNSEQDDQYKEQEEISPQENPEGMKDHSIIEHVEQSHKSSLLNTLPSITDASADDRENKLIFRPKARKSKFSSKSAAKTNSEQDDQYREQEEISPQENPEGIKEHTIFSSESINSGFFDTSLISSTKLILNPNTPGSKIAHVKQTLKGISNSEQKSSDSNLSINTKSKYNTLNKSKFPQQDSRTTEDNTNVHILDSEASDIHVDEIVPDNLKKIFDSDEKHKSNDLNDNTKSKRQASFRGSTVNQDNFNEKHNLEISVQNISKQERAKTINESLGSSNKGLHKNKNKSLILENKEQNMQSHWKNSDINHLAQNTSILMTSNIDEEIGANAKSQEDHSKSKQQMSVRGSTTNKGNEETAQNIQSNIVDRNNSPENSSNFGAVNVVGDVRTSIEKLNILDTHDENITTQTRQNKSNNLEIANVESQRDRSTSKQQTTRRGSLMSQNNSNENVELSIPVQKHNKSLQSSTKGLRKSQKKALTLEDTEQNVQSQSNIVDNNYLTDNTSILKTTDIDVANDGSTSIQKSDHSISKQYVAVRGSTINQDTSNEKEELVIPVQKRAKTINKSVESSNKDVISQKSHSKSQQQISLRESTINQDNSNERTEENMQLQSNAVDINYSAQSSSILDAAQRKSLIDLAQTENQLNEPNMKKLDLSENKKDKLKTPNQVKGENKVVDPKQSSAKENPPQRKKITDYFAKNIKLPKPAYPPQETKLPTAPKTSMGYARMKDGKIYRPRKLYYGYRWCNNRFYKFLQDKMQNMYDYLYNNN